MGSARNDARQQQRLRVLQGHLAGGPAVLPGSSSAVAHHASPDRLPGGLWEHESCTAAAAPNATAANTTAASGHPGSTHAQLRIRELVGGGIWEPRRNTSQRAAWCTSETAAATAPLPQLRGVAALRSSKVRPPRRGPAGITAVTHVHVAQLDALERQCRRV